MRHDPIDPAQSPGGESRAVTVTAADGREFVRILDVLASREVGDLEDRAARDAFMTIAAGLVARERKELDDIAVARRRLSTNTFSVCETCRAEIPLFRLRALPTTRVCVACQAKAESRGTAA